MKIFYLFKRYKRFDNLHDCDIRISSRNVFLIISDVENIGLTGTKKKFYKKYFKLFTRHKFLLKKKQNVGQPDNKARGHKSSYNVFYFKVLNHFMKFDILHTEHPEQFILF